MLRRVYPSSRPLTPATGLSDRLHQTRRQRTAGGIFLATYILVAGGWHGGWWLEPLARQLRSYGHEAHALTLTGLGDRSHLMNASVNLDTHIQDVVGLMESERIEDAVLLAHSYGGLVITGAADRVPERVKALVYIDAQVPRDGESLWSLTIEEHRRMFIESANDGYSVAPPPGLDPRTSAHPLASFVQPVRLTGAVDRIERKDFVFLSGWEGSPVRAIHERLLEDPEWKSRSGWTIKSLPIGHDIVGEAPYELLEIALQAEK